MSTCCPSGTYPINSEGNICCPAGYTNQPGDDGCVFIDTVPAVYHGSLGPAITRGSTNTAYGNFGTYFYPQIQNNPNLPIYRDPSTHNLIDQLGDIITPTNIVTGTNTFWFNNFSLGQLNGRLNNVGIEDFVGNTIGFTQCFELDEPKTLWIGLAADNRCQFTVNGTLCLDLSNDDSFNFKVWHVFPFNLSSGKNIIQMLGTNTTSGSSGSFGAEIYNPVDLATLTASTSTGTTGLIFSTLQKVGGYYDLSSDDSFGYSCALTGYSLDNCGTGFTCTEIIQTDYTTCVDNAFCIDCFSECISIDTINSTGGSIINNPDGTISVYTLNNNYNTLQPYFLTQPCCTFIGGTFDIETQKCMWSTGSTTCNIEEPFKIILNSNGDDGSLYTTDNNFNSGCTLNVNFDYLLKFDCSTLQNILFPNGLSGALSSIANPALNALLEQYQEQQVICEQLNNTLAYYSGELATTNYVIVCNEPTGNQGTTIVIPSGFTTSNGFFNNTAFGGLAFFMPDNMNNSINGINYCLSEPSGLQQWSQILGPSNYNQFLSGNPNSYTCDNVNSIIALNQQILTLNLTNNVKKQVLINECDQNFGDKTNLLNTIAGIQSQISACTATLTSLDSMITTLRTSAEASVVNNFGTCQTPVQVFETLDISMTIDIISGSSLNTIYTNNFFPAIGNGNMYNYLTTQSANTGFYVCGALTIDTSDTCEPINLYNLSFSGNDSINCSTVVNNIVSELFYESGLSGTTNGTQIFQNNIQPNTFDSSWSNFNITITDPNILSIINNQKIKISIMVNNACSNFCILLDNIQINRECTEVTGQNLYINQSPGFTLTKVRDNKKSWVNNSTSTQREFEIARVNGTNPIRVTNYVVADERLVINTKEIDLDVNIANAIESDVWNYVTNNPCILSGDCVTTCEPECVNLLDCPDFNSLLTTPLSGITTVEDFVDLIYEELIDAKDRKIINSYGTLRALYDRYMNAFPYCGINSNQFNYQVINQFANLVGNYWTDIIEQVVPATTIWGATTILSNTVFDTQKFVYRPYSLLFGANNYACADNTVQISGDTSGLNVEAITTTILGDNSNTLEFREDPDNYTYNNLYLVQYDAGSEFRGGVSVIGPNGISCSSCGTDSNTIILNACDLTVNTSAVNSSVVIIDGNHLSVILNSSLEGGIGPFSYQWFVSFINPIQTTIDGNLITTSGATINGSANNSSVNVTIYYEGDVTNPDVLSWLLLNIPCRVTTIDSNCCSATSINNLSMSFPIDTDFILQEDGFYILQEDGVSRMIRERDN